MTIAINLSEDDYRKVKDGRASVSMMRKAIINGTPLPKGHGRLIDGDELESRMKIGYYIVRAAPTIIEADKESEEEE